MSLSSNGQKSLKNYEIDKFDDLYTFVVRLYLTKNILDNMERKSFTYYDAQTI